MRHWYERWSCSAWIAVTIYSPAVYSQHFIVFSVCKMLRRDFFVMHLLGCTRHLSDSGSTGCQCRTEYSSSSAPWCSTFSKAPHHDTSQNCVIASDGTRLHSAARGNFAVHRTRLHVMDEAFSVAVPRVWNTLLADIKLTDSHLTFRRKLKTCLFKT